MESDRGVRVRQGTGCIGGKDARNEPQHVPTPPAMDVESSQRKATVVHMQGVREKMGENSVRDITDSLGLHHGFREVRHNAISRHSSVIQGVGSQTAHRGADEGCRQDEFDGDVCDLVLESARSVGRGGENGNPHVDHSHQSRGGERGWNRRCHGGVCGSDLLGSESSVNLEWVAELEPRLRHPLEEAVQHLVGFSSNNTLRGAQGMKSILLGLYSTQGIGITRASAHPTARRLLHCVHQAASPLGQPYWSVVVNCMHKGVELPEHTDQRNWPGTKSFVYSFGQYEGGELWQRCPHSGVEQHSQRRGGWVALDPRLPHGVRTVTSGTRWSVIVFVPGRLEQVPLDVWQGLEQLGFPRRQRLAQRLYHRFHQGGWQLMHGITLEAPDLHESMLQDWGYEKVDNQYVLSSWTDKAAEDGGGEEAAVVKCLQRREREAVRTGVQVAQARAAGSQNRAATDRGLAERGVELLNPNEIPQLVKSDVYPTVVFSEVQATVQSDVYPTDVFSEVHATVQSDVYPTDVFSAGQTTVKSDVYPTDVFPAGSATVPSNVYPLDVFAEVQPTVLNDVYQSDVPPFGNQRDRSEAFPVADMQEMDDDDPDAEGGPEANWEPSASERKAIRHVHDNLGHPPNPQLARMLKHAGARPEVAKWVRVHFKCDACARLTRPSKHLPSKHPATFALNQIMSMDTLFVPFQGAEVAVVHGIDWGTSYVQAKILPVKTAKETFRFWCQHWVAFLGTPKIVVTDSGTEYTGEDFRVGDLGSYHYITDARSPWQNGRCERSGKELKRQLQFVMEEVQPVDMEELENCLAQVVLVKNQYTNHAGYTPLQRLFGYAPDIPEALTQAARKAPLLWEGPQETIRRAELVRECAVRAWVRTESRSRLLRAARTQHRGQLPPLQVGQHVRVWRQPPYSKGQWVGPGQVLSVTNTGAYISIRGVLWKVSRENLRAATDEEDMASAMIERFISDLKVHGRPGIKRFLDCTRDPLPPELAEEGEDEPDRAEPNTEQNQSQVGAVASGSSSMPPLERQETASEQEQGSEGRARMDRQDTLSEPEQEGSNASASMRTESMPEQEEQSAPASQRMEIVPNLPVVPEEEDEMVPVPAVEETPVPQRGRRARSTTEEDGLPMSRRPRTQQFPYPFHDGPFWQEEEKGLTSNPADGQDYWEERHDRWVRHHLQPRHHRCHPDLGQE
eukprot:6182397-Amphidinium_carterae.1